MLPQLLFFSPPDLPLTISGSCWELGLITRSGVSAKLTSVKTKLIANTAGTTVNSLSVFIC